MKANNKSIFLLLAMTLLSSACAHHRDVRPGPNGVHRVVIKSDDMDDGEQDAIRQANHYCEAKNKEAAFVHEDKKYTGDLDEATYRNGKRVATVAKTIGGGVWAGGGKNESTIGGLAGLGGMAGDAALGKAYKVEMKFRCQ